MQDRAKEAAKKTGRWQTGGGKPPADKAQQRIKQLEMEVRQLKTEFKPQANLSTPATIETDDDDSQANELRKKIGAYTTMLQRAKLDGIEDIQVMAENRLTTLREKLSSLQKPETRHAAVSRKLVTAKKQLTKLHEAKEIAEQASKEAQAAVLTCQATIVAKEAEIKELAEVTQRTAAATSGCSGSSLFHLSERYLEGNQEVKDLLASEAFTKLQHLLAQQTKDVIEFKPKPSQTEAPNAPEATPTSDMDTETSGKRAAPETVEMQDAATDELYLNELEEMVKASAGEAEWSSQAIREKLAAFLSRTGSKRRKQG